MSGPVLTKTLVLHVTVPGFNVEDVDELLAQFEPGDGYTLLDMVTEEWMRDTVGLTLVTVPGEKCLNDDFEVHAFAGQIVGAEIREADGS